MKKRLAGLAAIIVFIFGLTAFTERALGFPLTMADAAGRPVTFERPPRRAISLVPSITEMICAIGAREALKGVTYHDLDQVTGRGITVVGGFASPSLDAMASLEPDVIFISDMHRTVLERFADGPVPVLFLKTDTLARSWETIDRLGLLFDGKERADALVADIRATLSLIADKTGRIPANKRQRVLRLMGVSDDRIMTPGADSFQNEMIRAAGGIPHAIDQAGAVIPLSLDQWQAFDPQMIYGCGGRDMAAENLLNRPGWREVSAVKAGRVHSFPCDLTCRAAAHTGDFVAWLAATLYAGDFAEAGNLVLAEKVLTADPLSETAALPDYISNGQIVRSRIYDFVHKSLILDFTEPLTVLSSLEGWRRKIRTAGNHFFPPPCWPISHQIGLEKFQGHVLDVLDREQSKSAFLFTGADMDNLSVRSATYKEITAWAFVTAGVRGNALRMGTDQGFYYEPGTINIIVLANRALTPRAMTRAIITATEAKTAALLDIDVRSSQNQGRHRATGTGTDNIIVVQGQGDRPALDNAGGHSRLGQLIAEAVYAGVREAVAKQSRLTEKRDIFQRLEERHIALYDLIAPGICECRGPKDEIRSGLETALLDPVYAGFVELSLAVSDDYEKGLLTDLTAFDGMALDICSRLAEKEITRIEDYIDRQDLPVVIETALNALLTGIYQGQSKNR